VANWTLTCHDRLASRLRATFTIARQVPGASATISAVHPAYCPNCGERVTPYAAGCALCGAELDQSRWHRKLSFGQRLAYYLPRRVRLALERRRS
jgi:predicted amidophosphoribosyltransferase